jgi:hypothetical protein
MLTSFFQGRHECQQAEEVLIENLLVRDWPILCGHEQAFQGPLRTSQHIAARQSSMAKNLFKDPEVLLRWSWDCDPEDFKNNLMVQAHKR